MLGFGLIGPVLAIWGEGVSVVEKIDTGELTNKILFTEVYPDDNNIFARIDNEDGINSHSITIDINQVDDKNTWVCNTNIENQGTIPVRFLPPTIFADNALQVEFYSPDQVAEPGKQCLNPGDSIKGQIRIGLTTEEPGLYSFQMNIHCIQWNALNNDPGWWTDTLHVYGTVVVEEPTEELYAGSPAAFSPAQPVDIVVTSGQPAETSPDIPGK